jgi:hypothetical protein
VSSQYHHFVRREIHQIEEPDRTTRGLEHCQEALNFGAAIQATFVKYARICPTCRLGVADSDYQPSSVSPLEDGVKLVGTGICTGKLGLAQTGKSRHR